MLSARLGGCWSFLEVATHICPSTSVLSGLARTDMARSLAPAWVCGRGRPCRHRR